MKQLLNTLFVTSEDIYLSLEGENVLANRDKTVVARYPLHTLQAIVSFSYAGASPALMGKCAEAGIGLAFCSPHGRFLARTCGESSGNVLLRREQYRIADDPARSCEIARTMIFGKLSNGAASIQRTLRDHAPRVADCGLEKAAANLRAMLPQVLAAADLDSLRGIEGAAATAYFDVLDHMLLSRKEAFFFHGRSRRPPLDRVNAMLSFLLQSAGTRLCQRLGKRRIGQLCRLPPPRPAGTAVVGAGSDGGAATLHGRPLRADPREQSNAAPGGLSDAGQWRGAAVR